MLRLARPWVKHVLARRVTAFCPTSRTGLPACHYDTQAMRMHAPSGGVQIPQLALQQT